MWLLTGLAWGARRMFGIRLCPICAGVASTWLWILGGIYIGWLETDNWRLVAALAMGGSVVGSAYQLEKRLSPNQSALLWKMLFIPMGFVVAYGFAIAWWAACFGGLFAGAILTWIFFRVPHKRHATSPRVVEELEDKMKNCC